MALAYGSVRLRNRCDAVLAPLLTRPLAALDAPLRAVLRVGAYELLWAEQCEAAPTVHALVELAGRLGHEGWRRLTNAVLRAVARRVEELRVPAAELDAARDPVGWLTAWESLPAWLAERWCERFGAERALALGQAANAQPVLCLRVNPLRATRDELQARLAGSGCSCTPGDWSGQALRVESAGPPERLPGWREGWCSVQDEAAMLIAALAEPTPGARVLDLCAAPGGKATHLAELLGNQGQVLACDESAERLAQLAPAAKRLGLDCITPLVADARGLAQTVAPADVVVLDAPCTGTGTLARRVDLRWRLGPERLAAATSRQAELLRTAAALVKPGGVLVYATCSLEPEENQEQLERLAHECPTLAPDSPAAPPPGWDRERGWAVVWPRAGVSDGFFLARRRRV
jgi:16S rRNA (cytosine967-C5)-methyltransferase